MRIAIDVQMTFLHYEKKHLSEPDDLFETREAEVDDAETSSNTGGGACEDVTDDVIAVVEVPGNFLRSASKRSRRAATGSTTDEAAAVVE